jgi:single-strand DNA-binding protein
MSVNKVILVGNLGRDPEIRYLPNGDAVANFSIATSERWKGKDGQQQERTEWHNIVMFRKLAEIASQYLKKGRTVYIEGRIQSRKYDGKDGVERTAYEIVADQMQMVGGRGGDDAAAPSSREAPQPPKRQDPAPTGGVAPNRSFDDMDDDIPFISGFCGDDPAFAALYESTRF